MQPFPAIACGLLLLQAACSKPAEGTSRSLTDGRGISVSVPATIRRIVSVAPNVTEMVCRIGAGDRLVGISDHCDWPPAIRTLPRVGGLVSPDSERIARLQPDLVLASLEGNPPHLAESMRAAGIPLFCLRIDSLQALRQTEQVLASLLLPDRQPASQSDMEKNLSALRGRLAGKQVFFQIGTTVQAWSFGAGTLVDDLVREAGARNLGAGRQGSFPQFDSESLSALRPDLVLLLSGSNPLADRAFWTRHAPRARIITAPDPAIYERPGPRLLPAIAALAEP